MHEPPEASVHHYPAELEQAWLKIARSATGKRAETQAIQALVPEFGRLTDQFTDRRPRRFMPYLDDRRTLAAYGLAFHPRNWARVRFPLAEWADCFGGPRAVERRPFRLLDLGSGPGPAGLSIAQWLMARGLATRVGLTLVDHSREALALGRSLADGGMHALTVRTDCRDLSRSPAPAPARTPAWDGILMSFFLNECIDGDDPEALWQAIEPWARQLGPGGWLLVVDLAEARFARNLEQVRRQLAASSAWTVLGPDRFEASHPLTDHSKRWPHEVRAWRPPESISRIQAALRRGLDDLKYSALLLRPADRRRRREAEGPGPWADSWRLMSPVGVRKGTLIWHMVDPDGRAIQAEIQKRALGRERQAWVRGWHRGDRLRLDPGRCTTAGERLRLLDADAVLAHYQPT